MKRLRNLLMLVALVLVFVPGRALAQSEADKTTARALTLEGLKALEAKDYKTAADRFKRAESLYHAPTIQLGLARSYVGLGKYVEAMETYNLVIRTQLPDDASDAFKQAVEDARTEVEGLDRKIGWVTITVEGPEEPKVKLDEGDVSVASLGVKRAVNPGSHVLRASADGFRAGETSFTIEAGSTKAVSLKLEADPDAVVEGGGGGTPPLLIAGAVMIGVGAAGLLVGAVTGGLAIGKHSDLENNCPGGQCQPDQQDTLDSYHTLGTVSTVGFIVGGVLAGAGIIMLAIAVSGGSSEDSGADSAQLSAEIGAGYLGAKLRF